MNKDEKADLLRALSIFQESSEAYKNESRFFKILSAVLVIVILILWLKLR